MADKNIFKSSVYLLCKNPIKATIPAEQKSLSDYL